MGIESVVSERVAAFIKYSDKMGRHPILDAEGKLPQPTREGALYHGYLDGRFEGIVDQNFLNSLKDSPARVAYRCAYKHGVEDREKRDTTSSSAFQ